MKNIDAVYDSVSEYAKGFELKYNKFYIGLSKNGSATNFITFRPRKQYFYIDIWCGVTTEKNKKLDDLGLDYQTLKTNSGYRIRIDTIDNYINNKSILDDFINEAMERRNIEA